MVAGIGPLGSVLQVHPSQSFPGLFPSASALYLQCHCRGHRLSAQLALVA